MIKCRCLSVDGHRDAACVIHIALISWVFASWVLLARREMNVQAAR